MNGKFLVFSSQILVFSFLIASAQPRPSVAYLSHEQSRPVFEALGEPQPSAGEWPRWIADSDRATRSRVAFGDELSVVNLLLYGTSFTNQPRITTALPAAAAEPALTARLKDFERALQQANRDERFQYARRVVGEGAGVGSRLREMVDRAARDQANQARLDKEARSIADPSLQFAERSRMYRDRGLASDTSLRVNFAIEQALRSLRERLKRVARVAVIGPGLDFTDKQEGFDFYPIQTLQPFALADSLIRLGLSDARSLDVTTIDLSAQVNTHLTAAKATARSGPPYVIHAVLDGAVSWTPVTSNYFEVFGRAIAKELPSTLPTAAGALRLRTLSVDPVLLDRINVTDVNITAQRLDLAAEERFDLVVATNVFLYYDRLQQGLAMVAISNMLKPGGILFSNNALAEVPAVGLKSGGYTKTAYSDRAEDGDLVIWYEKVVR